LRACRSRGWRPNFASYLSCSGGPSYRGSHRLALRVLSLVLRVYNLVLKVLNLVPRTRIFKFVCGLQALGTSKVK
jgi:hypothetical protein